MGEYANLGGKPVYVADLWEIDTDTSANVPDAAWQAARSTLVDDWDACHEVDADDLLSSLIQALGPAIVATALRELIQRSRPQAFVSVELLRQVIADQDRRLAERLAP